MRFIRQILAISLVRVGPPHVSRSDLFFGVTGSGMMTVEQKRMEEAAKRAAQRAVNQLRMSRRTLRAGAGQVTRVTNFERGVLSCLTRRASR